MTRPTFRLAAFGLLAGMGTLGATPALACPNYQLTGQQLVYSAQDVWVPQSHAVVAGGNINLASCGIGAHGYVIANPDFELILTDNTPGYEIEFRVEAACDTVLLVNDAYAQWQFNDDFNGFNPLIRLADAPAATYDIWVGTFGQQNCQANLIIESFPASAAPAQPPAPQAMADPGNLTSYRGQTGAVLSFTVTGSDRGSVWGSGIYTDDSRLAVAAVHAGVLAVGETGTVDVRIEPGQPSYSGSAAYGITSSNYGSWSGSYSFVGAPDIGGMDDPGNLTSYRGQNGAVLSFTVTGSDRGSVWGSGIYTDDSRLAVAAVHAGVLAVGETGTVDVRIEPGQPSYSGSAAYGITSSNYGSWSGSYSFPAAVAPAPAPVPAAPAPGASK